MLQAWRNMENKTQMFFSHGRMDVLATHRQVKTSTGRGETDPVAAAERVHGADGLGRAVSGGAHLAQPRRVEGKPQVCPVEEKP